VRVFEDSGISVAKGRDARPGLDALMKGAAEGIDTSTPSGKAMFQMMGVFAEFERSMMRERVLAGMSRAAASGTRSGKPIGLPGLRLRPKLASVPPYRRAIWACVR
jgi:DNA invertase Pin-like site-specific DNA recombinase